MNNNLIDKKGIECYINEYNNALIRIKILMNECKEILSFLKNGISKLESFIKDKKILLVMMNYQS